ncbi:MAG: alpha/beta hydrolase [Bacteroidales bacterium]|nr:alpha/beta hydrolase [Bacteroidales bacterium]
MNPRLHSTWLGHAGTWLLAFAAFFSLASCTGDLLDGLSPQEIYDVFLSDPEESGVAVISGYVSEKELKGIFYRDGGKLYADTLGMTVKEEKGALIMVFPDGSSRPFTFRPYEQPAYEELVPVRIYRDSVFEVTVERDVLYGQAQGYWTSYPPQGAERFSKVYFDRAGELLQKRNCPLTMDVYLPRDTGSHTRPLFLMIHGGAFYNGDKAEPEFEGWCRYFASMGYVAASINYRMGYLLLSGEVDKAGYRALQDANAAIRYLVGHEAYRIDPQLVFVAGTSAGAITALNLAWMTDKERPRSSRGGAVGQLLDGVFGNNPVDEGRIDAINPGDTTSFKIRAIGNMWGAVPDLAMLRNANVSIVSFHSENDPIVPYGYDYPFRVMFRDVFESISENEGWRNAMRRLRVSENINSVVFEKMYGSLFIDQQARRLGYRSELHTYSEKAHALHQDEEGNLLPRFYEIEHLLADFFSSEMEAEPVRSHLDSEQWIRVNNRSVRHLSWKLEGGVVRETASDGIRVLLMPDAPVHRVTVTGDYRSGMTFKETINL